MIPGIETITYPSIYILLYKYKGKVIKRLGYASTIKSITRLKNLDESINSKWIRIQHYKNGTLTDFIQMSSEEQTKAKESV